MHRAFLGLIRKEFIQVFRDRNMLRIVFAMPIIQLLLFGYVVNLEVKNIRLDVYDFDQSRLSREFVSSTKAGGYFSPTPAARPLFDLERNFQDASRDMAVVIPDDFSERIARKESVTIGLMADGSDANATSIGSGYLAQIVQKFSRRVHGFEMPVDIKHRILYNPEAQSVYFMVPGIVATLLTMVTVMLTSMAIVREREGGTLEQLLVTPMSGITLLAGKLVPFGLLGLFEMSMALTVGVLWFGIPFAGSPLLLLVLSALYLLTTLGMGLFFSTVTTTQQQAMFFAWFFSIFAILTSGFFTPIANMPEWMQYITYANPMRFFMSIVRGIMMKGSGPVELLGEIYTLAIFGLVVLGFSALRFSKRAA
ncbi:MAG: ABC transporter permease [Candidatus Zixiibacteriota bacterium]|nr:MAG: ABC transporter permease [candidate division Zixibacteria bacterium]